MSDKLVSPGNILTLTAPSGGVESGDFLLIGDLFVHAIIDADAGEPFTANAIGVHKDCPADNTTAFSEGDALYWNDTDGKIFDADDGGTGTGHPLVGHAAEAKAEAATTCVIRIQQ